MPPGTEIWKGGRLLNKEKREKKRGYRLFAQANEQDNLYPVGYGIGSITDLFYQIAATFIHKRSS
jgi:hypothetical protein